jgi:hypothetical protein
VNEGDAMRLYSLLRAATGHVVKTVIPLMKSRRRIACPEAQDKV